MNTALYYFSGTGNSLYVAQALQRRLPEATVVPMVKLLQHRVIPTQATTVGFIFPVHALTIPLAVRHFLQRIELQSAEYVFAIATRLGLVFREFHRIDRLLQPQHRQLDAQFLLNMSSNDVKDQRYTPPTQGDITRVERHVCRQLDIIHQCLLHKAHQKDPDTDFLYDLPYNRPLNALLEKFIVACMTVSEWIGGVNYFCTDAKCTGCGICERVCLSRKIVFHEGHPLWQKHVLCYMCYACVNFCPVQAVQINSLPGVQSYTRQNGRYSHPYATVRDMAMQKGCP